MKLLLAGCLFFLALSQSVPASDEGPITSYFPYADKIYLVRVIDVKQGVATFSVAQALRGDTIPTISLKAEFPELFKPGTDWAILSCEPWRKTGFGEDMVGDFLKGNRGWIFAKVVKTKDKDHPYDFTTDELNTALKTNPQKPWPK